jgi:4-hydroxythreonine-4-phosphate dehydrogenase
LERVSGDKGATIGITIGDPAGIGPEIVVHALHAADPALVARVRVYGDRGVLARAADALALPALAPSIELVEVTRLRADEAVPGRPDPSSGAAQVAYLDAAIEAARRGELGALVTAPISKAHAKAAGLSFPGHTELLAERLGAPEHAMAFVGPRLRVVLATIHEPLRRVPDVLTPGHVARAAVLGTRLLARSLGVAEPRVGVLGLNPHAGEQGHFGDEEARLVVPGIEAARERLLAEGITATLEGPLVPDAAWRDACWDPLENGTARAPARWDLLVALYHDQGLIPVKLVDFEDAVNVTLGLPIVRTSPDHGTAFDIAGTGRARHRSFLAALGLAARMSDHASERSRSSDSAAQA